jgi:hypothetical protein
MNSPMSTNHKLAQAQTCKETGRMLAVALAAPALSTREEGARHDALNNESPSAGNTEAGLPRTGQRALTPMNTAKEIAAAIEKNVADWYAKSITWAQFRANQHNLWTLADRQGVSDQVGRLLPVARMGKVAA